MRAERERKLTAGPPAWLVVGALAAVVGLSVISLALDLVVGHKTALATAQLVDDSVQSIALADDLRYQAHRLSTTPLERAQLLSIVAQIGADARQYDPIAIAPGERSEWSTLQLLLARLQQERDDPGAIPSLVAQIEQSIARLIDINQVAARDHQLAIAELHRRGLVADAAIGAITLALAIGVGYALLRSLRRQRQLARMQLAALDDHSRELEAFAGRVAHDLRGPLAPIVGFTDLLVEPGADVAAVATRIRRAADRMATLIDDLLALSVAGRLPNGRGDVATAVREVLDDLGGELRDAEVKLAVAECTAACTPGVLAQLMRNLVTNAIKYRGSDRRLLLQIDARPSPAPTGQIEIVVSDNGVGMTGEAVRHAFDPFYRASSTRAIPGHGLGLAIVKRTLDAMGGDCELASVPNEGTRVTLRVPEAGAPGHR